MKGNKEDARSFNKYLDFLKTQLYDCHKNLLQSGADINTDSLRNAFMGVNDCLAKG